MSWPKIEKIIILKHCLLLLYTTKNHFSIGLWRVMKSGFYTTTDDNQLSGWTEKKPQSTFPKPNLNQKKKERSWLLFGGLLPMWSTTAFWIPAKPLHLRSMLSELIRCPQNYNVCSQHWSTIWPQFFPTTMPNCTWHNKCFKSWMHWAVKFCLICHIHLISCQQTTTSSSILTTFCRESASTSRRRQKILSMSSWTPKAWIFMLQE